MIEFLVNLILAILAMIGSYQAPTVSPEATVITCQEDMPCWDCETMGNGICGPIAPTYEVSPNVPTEDPTPIMGEPLVVTQPCYEDMLCYEHPGYEMGAEGCMVGAILFDCHTPLDDIDTLTHDATMSED